MSAKVSRSTTNGPDGRVSVLRGCEWVLCMVGRIDRWPTKPRSGRVKRERYAHARTNRTYACIDSVAGTAPSFLFPDAAARWKGGAGFPHHNGGPGRCRSWVTLVGCAVERLLPPGYIHLTTFRLAPSFPLTQEHRRKEWEHRSAPPLMRSLSLLRP